MILAATDWLSISITLLVIVLVITCLLMSLIILMQRPKQEGLGAAFGAGMTDQMFGARTTNVLQKGTVYLASTFFILTLTLAILFAKKNERAASLVADVPEVAAEEAVVEEAPAAPSLEEQLQEEVPVQQETPAPAEESATPAEDAAEAPASTEEAPAEETPAAEDTETPAEEAAAEPAETPAPEAEEAPAGQ